MRYTGRIYSYSFPVVKSENFGRLFELSLHYRDWWRMEGVMKAGVNLLTIAKANTRQHGDLQHIRMTTMVTNVSTCL